MTLKSTKTYVQPGLWIAAATIIAAWMADVMADGFNRLRPAHQAVSLR